MSRTGWKNRWRTPYRPKHYSVRVNLGLDEFVSSPDKDEAVRAAQSYYAQHGGRVTVVDIRNSEVVYELKGAAGLAQRAGA